MQRSQAWPVRAEALSFLLTELEYLESDCEDSRRFDPNCLSMAIKRLVPKSEVRVQRFNGRGDFRLGWFNRWRTIGHVYPRCVGGGVGDSSAPTSTKTSARARERDASNSPLDNWIRGSEGGVQDTCACNCSNHQWNAIETMS